MLAVSPDGSRFAYVANRRLYVRAMRDPEAHAVPGTENPRSGLTNLVFSPGGLQLAFYSNDDQSVKRIGVAGGTVTAAATNPLGMRWDEQGIVFGQTGKGILRVSPNGGVPELVAAVAADEMAASPQLLPGDRGIMFSLKKMPSYWEDGQVVVQSREGKRTTVMKGAADGQYLAPGRLLYAQSGVVLAAPFDLDRLAMTARAVPVIQGIARTDANINTSGAAQFGVAGNGTLVYRPGPVKAETAQGDLVLAIFDGRDQWNALPYPSARIALLASRRMEKPWRSKTATTPKPTSSSTGRLAARLRND